MTREDARKIQGAYRDFKTERPTTEYRIAPNNAGIHDRYIVTKDLLLILGHGFKDIGGKESFVIRIDKVDAPDLIKSLQSSFDALWTRSTPL